MKILVTGAAGFIGSNFVHVLLKHDPACRVVVLDKLTYAGNYENLAGMPPEFAARLVFVKGDINDRPLLDRLFLEHEFDKVMHFAAESHVDRSIDNAEVFLATNVLGTHALLEAARKHWRSGNAWRSGRRFVQVSTDEVYGSLGAEGHFQETTPVAPRNPYAASKASADHLVLAFQHTFGLPACITRCSNNYGPFQFPEKLIPLMIRNALRHEHLPVYGDGRQIRDWLFVEDHCRALIRVLDGGRSGEVYNIGGRRELENLTLVKVLLDALRSRTGDPAIGAHLIQHVADRPGHDRRYAIDATKIERELGWRPEVEFEQGLARTVDWYLAHREWTERIISGEYLDFYEKNYGRRG